MTTRTAYVVTPTNPEDLAAERAAGSHVLYEGDAAGVVRFFQDLTQGCSYAVLATAPPARREQVRGSLLRCVGLAAQLKASMFGIRVLFPVEPSGLESTAPDLELDVITTLDQWLYDDLPRLDEQLHRLIYAEGRDEESLAGAAEFRK